MQYLDISYLGLQELDLTEMISLNAGRIIPMPTPIGAQLLKLLSDWCHTDDTEVYYGGDLIPAVCIG